MNYKHESPSDIPLIVAFCERLKLVDMIDKVFKLHGNQKGLSNGQLVLGWIAHILTQGNHCKSPVEDWAAKHKITLQALLGKEITENDFEDCRLGRILEKLADNDLWHELESSFYRDSLSVFQLNTNVPEDFKLDDSIDQIIYQSIKIDSTTAYGHHKVVEDGIMQRGWSKDHRSDLPQLKLMVSVEGNTGLNIASNIVPGNEADDPLYLPVIKRTRGIINKQNLLFCGDSKMCALYIRADIIKNKDFYLIPMQLGSSKFKNEFDNLVNMAVKGTQESNLIFDTEIKGNECVQRIIGAGFEISREQLYQDKNEKIHWTERLLIIRSFDHVKEETKKFNRKIEILRKNLETSTTMSFGSEEEAKKDLIKKINIIFKNDEQLKEIFRIEIHCYTDEKEYQRTEKRKGVIRNGTYKINKGYKAKAVMDEDKEKLNKMREKLGWRVYTTNIDKNYLTLSSAYRFYRKTMCVVEIGFHELKDYTNISPLYVRNEKQIMGITRLLMLSLKILKLMASEIRTSLREEKVILKGLYAGQPARKHAAPTAISLLNYFSRQSIALIGINKEETWIWEITSLTDTCKSILKYLKIPDAYLELPNKLNLVGLIS
jgi:transposase